MKAIFSICQHEKCISLGPMFEKRVEFICCHPGSPVLSCRPIYPIVCSSLHGNLGVIMMLPELTTLSSSPPTIPLCCINHYTQTHFTSTNLCDVLWVTSSSQPTKPESFPIPTVITIKNFFFWSSLPHYPDLALLGGPSILFLDFYNSSLTCLLPTRLTAGPLMTSFVTWSFWNTNLIMYSPA